MLCLIIHVGVGICPRPPLRREPSPSFVGRRQLLRWGCGVCHGFCFLDSVSAKAELQSPPSEILAAYDSPRNKFRDAAFAQSMATTMSEYEAAAAPAKARLFSKLLQALPQKEAVIVELGMGTFPNARFYATASPRPKRVEIIGIDPNDESKPARLDLATQMMRH